MQRLVQSYEFAFRRNGQLFALPTQPRVVSLSVTTYVNATVAQLFEVVHHGRQLSVQVRVTLLTCAELCTRLQLCSTARTFHSDPSLAGSLTSSSQAAPAVPRQSSAKAGLVVTRSGDSFSILSCAAWCGRQLAPPPCMSEDLSFVTSQCSVIVRDFACGALIGPPTASRP